MPSVSTDHREKETIKRSTASTAPTVTTTGLTTSEPPHNVVVTPSNSTNSTHSTNQDNPPNNGPSSVSSPSAGGAAAGAATGGGSNMIGKKIKVFWPVDERWYTGVVQEYNATTGEHRLKYPDGDEEWVKIGENGNNNEVSPDSDKRATTGSIDPSQGGTSQPRNQSSPNQAAAPSVPPMIGGGGILGRSGSPNDGRSPDFHRNDISPSKQQQQQHHHPMYNDMMNGINPANFMNPYHQPPHFGMPHHPAAYGPGAFGPGGLGPAPHGFHPHFGAAAGMPFPPPPGSGPPHHVGPHHPHHPHHRMGGGGGGPGGPGGISPSRSRNRDSDHFNPHHVKDGSPPSHHHRKSTPDSSEKTVSGSKKKSGPKTWSKEEDSQLLNMVQKMRMPIKWSLVSQSMPDRTGKQCRERYVNHLNPRLKNCDWSPAEDATIFHLYNTCGSQWAKMSKMIPGRTDNGIKNRFHNLRRQLEREDEHRIRLSKAEDFPDEVKLEKIRDFPDHLRGKCDALWAMTDGVGVLAAQSVLGGSFARNAGRFGPFKKADPNGEQCARCGLFAPSTQCGTQICSKTGWCIACTRLPPHMCSNILRECLNLRRIEEDGKDEQETKLIKAGALNLALADASSK